MSKNESAELRRKNQGKQYALAHIPSRVVFAWHRPGEPLPKLVSYNGVDYLLTAETVEQARVSQRSTLLKVEIDRETNKLKPVVRGTHLALAPITWKNPKGGVEVQLVDTKWDKLKDWGVYAGTIVAAAAAAGLIIDHVKGYL